MTSSIQVSEAFGESIEGFGASYDRQTDRWTLYTMPGSKPFGAIEGRERMEFVVSALRAAMRSKDHSIVIVQDGQDGRSWFDKAIRDHEAEHGPSGGAWNISMVLERLHRAAPAKDHSIAVDDVDRVSLVECPIGLFWHGDTLCLKTEYGNNEGRIDAYIVESGEFYWGDAPQTIASQRAQLVTPIDTNQAIAVLAAIGSQSIEGERG